MNKVFPALLLVALLTGCGAASDNPTVGAAPVPSGTTTIEPGQGSDLVACVKQAATSPAPAGATKDLSTKPVVKIAQGPAPCDLQVSDFVVGAGVAAKSGDPLTVKYVGVLHSDGKEFDSSWSRGKDETYPFQLGAGNVIVGWDQGIVGMKVGGRRQLSIPAALAYGDKGQGTLPAGATLVFVVDLVKIGS